jgi:hypothetical protein
MHRPTALAITIAAVSGVSGLTVSPALASHGHAPGMNISFASGPDSSAHWLRRQQAVLFQVGAGIGDRTQFAEIVLHHFPATAPAQPPSFTVTGPGMPYLEIGLSGGGYLTGTAGGAWAAYGARGAVLASGATYPAALAAEQASSTATLTVDRVILADQQVPLGAAYTDTITSLQYNGVSLVPRGHRQAHARQRA